jgi:hypothetical protein
MSLGSVMGPDLHLTELDIFLQLLFVKVNTAKHNLKTRPTLGSGIPSHSKTSKQPLI